LIFLKNVFGNEPTTPPIILPIPSASTPEPTLLSSISILDTSPIAFKHPTASIVVTKYAGKNAIKSNVTPYSRILGISINFELDIAENSTIPSGI